MINRKSWLAAGLSLSLGGCAAWAVTQDALVDRTAHALGLERTNSRSKTGSTTVSRRAIRSRPTVANNTIATSAARSRCWGGWFRKLSAAKGRAGQKSVVRPMTGFRSVWGAVLQLSRSWFDKLTASGST